LAGSLMHGDSKSAEWRNRAFLIGPGGQIEWTQDKMNPYTFTAKHQVDTAWLLTNPPVDQVEAIQIAPQQLEVRDSPDGERYAVLICEDFARALPHHALVMELGLNRILVPVMNGERLNPDDWIKRYAINFAQEPYAASFIVNSGTLVRRKTTHIEDYVAIFDRLPGALVDHQFLLDPGTGHLSAILLTVKIAEN
jgi:hypothetical protein